MFGIDAVNGSPCLWDDSENKTLTMNEKGLNEMQDQQERKSIAAMKQGDDAVMSYLSIEENKDDIVRIGKNIVSCKPHTYTAERMDWIKEQLRILVTDRLSRDFSMDDLFYMSIYDYWAYGNTVSEEVCFDFPHKTHMEKQQYMTFRTRLNSIPKVSDKSLAHIFNNKYETYGMFRERYLRDIVKIDGRVDFESFKDFISRHPVFVYKPTSGALGRGVKKINAADYGNSEKLFAELCASGEINKKDCYYGDSSFLLEEVIAQDERLASMHPYSINAVRLSTLRSGRGVEIIYPWLKVGANKAFVTSVAFGTYDAGIDVATGLVYTDGYKENGEKDSVHPQTGLPFKGFQIPRWQEVVDLCKDLALNLPPGVNYVGWDMVLTSKGWCIMEGNFYGDFMWQMFREKGFREEWEQISGVKIGKEFWWQT